MKKIRFNIHSGNGLVSKAIKFITNGDFSHTSIDLGKDRIQSIIGGGVIWNDEQKFNVSPIIESYELSVTNKKYEELKLWSQSQVGKKYDYSAIISFIVPLFSKPRMGYWYCSELSYVIYSKAKGVLDLVDNQKVNPSLFRDIIRLDKRAKKVL